MFVTLSRDPDCRWSSCRGSVRMLSVFSIYIQKLADIVKNGLANIVFAIILRKRFVAMGTASGLSQSFTHVGESLMRFAVLVVIFRSQAFGADDVEFFESKVRPLLAEQCYACHSSKAKIVQGGLRLDSRETTLRGGHSGPALVPGNPDQSRLIRALRHEVEPHMPPWGKLEPEKIEVANRVMLALVLDGIDKSDAGQNQRAEHRQYGQRSG